MITRTETPEPAPQPIPEPDRPAMRPVVDDTPRTKPNRLEREPEVPVMVRTEIPDAPKLDRPSRPNRDEIPSSRPGRPDRSESNPVVIVPAIPAEPQPAPVMITAGKIPEAAILDASKLNPDNRPSRPGNGSQRPGSGAPVDVVTTGGAQTPEIMISPVNPVVAPVTVPKPASVLTNRPSQRPGNQGDFSRRGPQHGAAIPAVGLINLENTGPRAHRQSPQSPLDLSQMITRLRGVSAISSGTSGRVVATPIINRVVRVDPGVRSIIRYGNNLNHNHYDRCEYFRPVLTPHHRALISIQIGSPRIRPPFALHHGYVDPCRPYCIPAPPFIPEFGYTSCRVWQYNQYYYTIPEPSPRYSTYSTVPAAYPAPYSPPVATAVPLFGYGAEGDPNALSYQVDASSQLSTNEVNFLKNSTVLADGEDNVFLYNLAAALNSPELVGFKFVIEGHASAEGSAAANQKLSQLRANAIFDFLVNQGVAASRLLAVGHGEQQAVYQPTDPDYLRAKDRRVIIYKLADQSN